MVARAFLAVLGSGAGGVAACLLFWSASMQFKRMKARNRLVGGSETGVLRSLFGRMLRNGIAPFVPLAGLLMRITAVKEFAERIAGFIERKGQAVEAQRVFSVYVFWCLFVCAMLALITRSVMCGIAMAACITALCAAAVRTVEEKDSQRMQEAVPDALRSMEACFQSGYSLVQTFEQISKETSGDLQKIFLRGAHILQAGGTATEALAVLSVAGAPEELAFVSVALDVQHESGGSVKHVLESARRSVEGKLELARSMRVQTAQAQLSARVVSVMPFVLVALFTVISPGFLDPFFGSAAGVVMLGCAIAMQAAGIMVVRHLLRRADQ